MTGDKNPKYPVKALNFYMALHSSGSKQLFQYVSGNLFGPSLRHMQHCCTKMPSIPFINLNHEEIVQKIEHILKRIRDTHKSGRISFLAGVDATVVAKSWQLSAKHQAIVGGVIHII